MDDDFEKWEKTQQLAELSSSSQTKTSSSSEKAVSSSSKKNESDNTISSPNEKPISSSKEEKIVETSSSSAVIELPCKTKNNDNCVYGIIKDSRDGQEYKTVTIGSQIWMAQNLNTKVDSSYCVGQTEYGCTTYGRLYTWAAVIDSIGKFSNNSKDCGYVNSRQTTCSASYPIRGICPEGWHLPTSEEFKILINAVGGNTKPFVLQSKDFPGWNAATDEYGFTAKPIQVDNNGSNAGKIDFTIFWGVSINETDGRPESMGINASEVFIFTDKSGPKYHNSVRCLKD